MFNVYAYYNLKLCPRAVFGLLLLLFLVIFFAIAHGPLQRRAIDNDRRRAQTVYAYVCLHKLTRRCRKNQRLIN